MLLQFSSYYVCFMTDVTVITAEIILTKKKLPQNPKVFSASSSQTGFIYKFFDNLMTKHIHTKHHSASLLFCCNMMFIFVLIISLFLCLAHVCFVVVAWAAVHDFRGFVTCLKDPCCAAECLPFQCIKIRWVCIYVCVLHWVCVHGNLWVELEFVKKKKNS